MIRNTVFNICDLYSPDFLCEFSLPAGEDCNSGLCVESSSALLGFRAEVSGTDLVVLKSPYVIFAGGGAPGYPKSLLAASVGNCIGYSLPPGDLSDRALEEYGWRIFEKTDVRCGIYCTDEERKIVVGLVACRLLDNAAICISDTDPDFGASFREAVTFKFSTRDLSEALRVLVGFFKLIDLAKM